ncbi:TPA: LysR substrate-binding domain-containing protein, partial [Pseudomonas aeruginosa]
HACIRMRLGDNSFYKWELGDGERMVEVDVPGPFSVNESNTAVAAALDGIGLAYCLEVGIAEELRSGRLQLVLPDWTSMGAPFCLYYPSRRQPQPGLRQLMEIIRGDWLGRA